MSVTEEGLTAQQRIEENGELFQGGKFKRRVVAE